MRNEVTSHDPANPAFKSRAFLCGADMNPTAIRHRWPASRFVGIARADGVLTQGAGLGPNAFGPEVWGIIVEVGEPLRGMPVPLTLPNGSPATAMLASEPSAIGAPAEIFAEANYWELPQVYRDRIKAFIDRAAGD
jgi:hypothetical protein